MRLAIRFIPVGSAIESMEKQQPPDTDGSASTEGKQRLPKGVFSLADWCWTIFQGLVNIFLSRP
jgi:hypothetical protein